jgi:peptide/nickel transport system substrate-binding protein
MLGVAIAACAPEPAATEVPPEPTEAATEPVGEAPPKLLLRPRVVVAYNEFSQKFSPFYSDTAYDADVAAMTQISLLTTDRQAVSSSTQLKAKQCLTTVLITCTRPRGRKMEYDEATDTTKYTARLREDLKFSDGTPVTADDIIFSYYTFLDPSYVGSTTLGSYPIIGLKDYQTQTTTKSMTSTWLC